jgi:IS5 family transposase
MLDAIRPVHTGRPGRPRRRPAKLHADKGYDFSRCRHACRVRGIQARIARRGIDSFQRLGRHRWVVERTIAWPAQFKRLLVRFERSREMHLAFLTLAACLILERALQGL